MILLYSLAANKQQYPLPGSYLKMSRSNDIFPLNVQKFRDAYFLRHPSSLRKLVREEFLEVFGVKRHQFHHKLLGSNKTTISEREIQWMEEIDALELKKKHDRKQAREKRK